MATEAPEAATMPKLSSTSWMGDRLGRQYVLPSAFHSGGKVANKKCNQEIESYVFQPLGEKVFPTLHLRTECLVPPICHLTGPFDALPLFAPLMR